MRHSSQLHSSQLPRHLTGIIHDCTPVRLPRLIAECGPGPHKKELCPLARGSKVESIPVETAGTGVKVYTFLAPGPDAFVGESPGLQHTHRSALDSFHMHFTAH